jgi:hypothetical protein
LTDSALARVDAASGPEWWNRLRPALGRHWLFAAVFTLGFALRVVTELAYRPALLYIDSYRYLDLLEELDPTKSLPVGYDIFVLHPFLWIGNFTTVVTVQHVLGLAMGVAIYVVLLRCGVRPWIAAIATVPILLDAYQLQIEQNLMSEAFFETLVLAAVVVLLWNHRPSYGALVVAGLLLGTAVSVRLVGGALLVPAAAFAMVRSPSGWPRLWRTAAIVMAFLLPVIAYAGYFYSVSGVFGLTRTDAHVMYGRAATIVDCRALLVPLKERPLCPTEPLGHRKGVDEYAHDPSIASRLGLEKGTENELLRDFSRRVFINQPLDLAHAVLTDFVKVFAWDRTTTTGDVQVSRWQFQTSYPTFGFNPATKGRQYGGGGPNVNTSLAKFLRGYQLNVGFVPGPLLGLAFLAGLLGGLGVGRARGSGLRAACLLPTLCGLLLLASADAFEFSWRYQLPALVLAPLGGALGLTALTRAPPPVPDTDEHTPSEDVQSVSLVSDRAR